MNIASINKREFKTPFCVETTVGSHITSSINKLQFRVAHAAKGHIWLLKLRILGTDDYKYIAERLEGWGKQGYSAKNRTSKLIPPLYFILFKIPLHIIAIEKFCDQHSVSSDTCLSFDVYLKKCIFNCDAELQINKTTMVQSFHRCHADIWSGILAEVFICVK